MMYADDFNRANRNFPLKAKYDMEYGDGHTCQFNIIYRSENEGIVRCDECGAEKVVAFTSANSSEYK